MTAAAGQWIDSPSGRIARALEIDAAWQQLWNDQYGQHVPGELRTQFEEDFYTWQKIKESLASMGVLSIMAPATGELLDRWAVRQRDWYERFKEQQVKLTAPAPAPRLERRSSWEGPTKLAWGLAAVVASAALFAGVTYLATQGAAKRVLT